MASFLHKSAIHFISVLVQSQQLKTEIFLKLLTDKVCLFLLAVNFYIFLSFRAFLQDLYVQGERSTYKASFRFRGQISFIWHKWCSVYISIYFTTYNRHRRMVKDKLSKLVHAHKVVSLWTVESQNIIAGAVDTTNILYNIYMYYIYIVCMF